MSAEKKIANNLVLPYYLKDTGSFTMTANSFGVATNTIGLVVYLNTAIKHSTVHHFADDTNMLLINKSLIKTINKNINISIKKQNNNKQKICAIAIKLARLTGPRSRLKPGLARLM